MPKILEKNRAMFRVHAGDAELPNGEKIELSTSLHGSPVVKFEDGTFIYWEWNELINQAITLKNS